jgi:selenide,water dikinase
VDIGSTVGGLDLPGIRQHALPTRPISGFVHRVGRFIERARRGAAGRPLQVVVVGAGAGGVEVAFALNQRLRGEGVRAEVTLVHGGPRVLPGYPNRLVAKIEAVAERQGIRVRCGTRVVGASASHVQIGHVQISHIQVSHGETDGEDLPYDLLVWVTGAVAHPLWRDSGLPTDDRGFVWTRETLQVEGYDNLFAVGDCATLRRHPETPKAGVYAVRQGPYLIDNLRATLAGHRLRRYRPQSDFLTLLNLGDGRAVGGKWGWAAEGRWVMRLKDRIDRRFMRKFQVLQGDGALTEDFAAETMDMGEMLCGGCAAKVGQSVLERALGRIGPVTPDPTVVMGLEVPDDASAVRLPGGDVMVTSLDAFRAFTDDPYLVGKVGAANAASDLLAKGVTPRYALALVALPQDAAPEDNEEMLVEVLVGARETLDHLNITLLGGHTMTTPELVVGFTIDGLASLEGKGDGLLRIDGLKPGQRLILTKALGTGVLFHADMQGQARGPWIERAFQSMARTNDQAARVAVEMGATTATDITGFGVIGHLGEMARASGCSAVVDVAALPAIDGAIELMSLGLRSTFHPENERMKRGIIIRPAAQEHPKLDLLFDPQTSGGLLFGIAPERVDETIAALQQAGDLAVVIGEAVPARDDGAPIELIVRAGVPRQAGG